MGGLKKKKKVCDHSRTSHYSLYFRELERVSSQHALRHFWLVIIDAHRFVNILEGIDISFLLDSIFPHTQIEELF